MEKVILYFSDTPDIKISIELFFNENEELFFDGYDVGKNVKSFWGTNGYEYAYIIQPIEVDKLYPLLSVNMGDKQGLLNEIKNKFGGNNAYSQFGEFMLANDVDYKTGNY
jgi:hypothetical protein